MTTHNNGLGIPQEAFAAAYNGLSFFISEYPKMSLWQQTEIRKLVKMQSLPLKKGTQLKQYGTVCFADESGMISVIPEFNTEIGNIDRDEFQNSA